MLMIRRMSAVISNLYNTLHLHPITFITPETIIITLLLYMCPLCVFMFVCTDVCVSVFVCVSVCVCSSCDMSSASVQILEAVDQDLDAGKLTEADKAHTGRVSPSFCQYGYHLYPYYELKLSS